jgi:hypothetical protein
MLTVCCGLLQRLSRIFNMNMQRWNASCKSYVIANTAFNDIVLMAETFSTYVIIDVTSVTSYDDDNDDNGVDWMHGLLNTIKRRNCISEPQFYLCGWRIAVFDLWPMFTIIMGMQHNHHCVQDFIGTWRVPIKTSVGPHTEWVTARYLGR